MEYISYCGLICNECPVFIATAVNNQAAKERLAREFSRERMQFTTKDMNCFGCFHEDTGNLKMCGGCVIRNCGQSREVENCGYCDDYPCGNIETHVKAGSDNRKRLDNIHSLI